MAWSRDHCCVVVFWLISDHRNYFNYLKKLLQIRDSSITVFIGYSNFLTVAFFGKKITTNDFFFFTFFQEQCGFIFKSYLLTTLCSVLYLVVHLFSAVNDF